MITKLEIDGFKTFENFKIELSPFVAIAGANGSGKSNLFDAILLLSSLAQTDLNSAFQEQRGSQSELFTQYPEGRYAESMRFVVELLVDRQVSDNWGNAKTLDDTRFKYCLEISRLYKKGLEQLYITYEELTPIMPNADEWYQRYVGKDVWQPKINPDKNLAFIKTKSQLDNQVIYLYPEDNGIPLKHRADEAKQTVLSSVNNTTTFPHVFAVREEMRHWKCLQLNPVTLRQPSAILANQLIGMDGSNLPTTIALRAADDPFFMTDLSREINNLLPTIVSVKIEKDKHFDQYVLVSISPNGSQFSSNVLSEGTLRLIALCTFKLDPCHKGVLCLEEPENGIHPFKLENFIQLLRDLATDFQEDRSFPLRQLIVNTHSPILIANLFKHSEIDCQVLYAMLFSRIRKEHSLKLTKIIPVTNQYVDDSITEPARKVTLSEVKRYLEIQSINQDFC